jgi:hypothetical protein
MGSLANACALGFEEFLGNISNSLLSFVVWNFERMGKIPNCGRDGNKQEI